MFKFLISSALLILTVYVIELFGYTPKDMTTRPGVEAKINHRERMHSIVRRAVRIEVVCGFEHNGRMGSGVVIGREGGETLVATAEHVVEAVEDLGCDMIVRDWQGMSGYAEVVKRDETYDVAVLKVSEKVGEVAGLYRGAYIGQAISCVGWPRLPYEDGLDRLSITRGYVSTMDVGGFLRISADIYFGNSGGACFSKKGHVVGIVSYFKVGGGAFGEPSPRPGQFYISDVENLKNLLDS